MGIEICFAVVLYPAIGSSKRAALNLIRSLLKSGTKKRPPVMEAFVIPADAVQALKLALILFIALTSS